MKPKTLVNKITVLEGLERLSDVWHKNMPNNDIVILSYCDGCISIQ